MKNSDTNVMLSKRNFTRKISVSVAVIVFALFGLTITAWSMFGITAGNIQQTISPANFYVSSTVMKDGKAYTPSAEQLYEAGEYTVTLSAKGSVKERSGFCRILINENEKWYTPQMRTEKQKSLGKLDGCPDKVSFKLILNEAATVSFSSSWAEYKPEFSEKCVKTDGSTVITYGTAPAEPVTAE